MKKRVRLCVVNARTPTLHGTNVSNIGLKGRFWVVEEHIRQAAVALHTIVSYRSRLFCIVSRKWLQDGFQHIRRHSKEKRAENVTKTCRFRSKLS